MSDKVTNDELVSVPFPLICVDTLSGTFTLVVNEGQASSLVLCCLVSRLSTADTNLLPPSLPSK